jgi:hypothetical protein
MDSELLAELNQLLVAWKADLSKELARNIQRKDLVDTGELMRSVDKISFQIQANRLQIVVDIAPQGRFQDLKRLRNKPNKNRWSYAKLLAKKVAALEDDIIILMANYTRQKLLNSFKNGSI